MALQKKNDNITPVGRTGFPLVLTSSNQDGYPIVYGEDVWTIVKNSTEIGKVVSAATSSSNYQGTYTTDEVLEAIAKELVYALTNIGPGGSVEQQIEDAINALDSTKTGSSNGFSVTATQTNGIITSITVSAPNVDSVVATKIQELDSEVTGSQDGVTVKVTEVDGKLTSVEVTNTLLGKSTDATTANTIHGVRNYAQTIQTYAEGVRSYAESVGAEKIKEAEIRNLFNN